ncbi:MAG: murein peptide amidase A [Deltaproteobacteria bacterium]|nr:murein peptide amidase A [Deltaproteobacteria bacterium]
MRLSCNHIKSLYRPFYFARPFTCLLSISVFILFFTVIRPAPAEEQPVTLEQTYGQISDKLASVALRDCLDGGFILSGGYSNKRVPILVREYGPMKNRKPRAKVLLVGGTHGDEYASVSVVFKWMQILNIHHSGLFHWIFIPLLNPDGLLQSKSTRTNARGVDLNRNLPGPTWLEAGYGRWQGKAGRNPRYYPGPCPMSEPETRFLVNIINDFRPDVIVSLHSPLNLVDYDGPGKPPSSLGSLKLRRLGNFPGTLGNYGGVQNKTPVITIELASSSRMPSGEEISSMWRDLVKWLTNNAPVEPLDGRIYTAQEDVLIDELEGE